MNQAAINFLDSRIPVCLGNRDTLRDEGEFAITLDTLVRDCRILNKTGKQIYQACDDKTSVGEIIDRLQAYHKNVPKDQIRRDVYCYLRDLEKMKFISIRKQNHC